VGTNQYLHIGPPDNLKQVDFPKVKQGYLEASNVNAIKNLTQMILAHRSYEAYQQAIKNYDAMMEKSNSKLATVGR
ncbi:MAG: hypothetical protein OXT67_04090, partial [Zetaproteobacteria bacterium]|nr:hypothetical protein [Zetaproteobacteria bacterium]